MPNPYTGRPDFSFWRRSVSSVAMDEIDPVVRPGFLISPSDRIATAGSCFAQHIAKTLQRDGYNYFVTEEGPSSPGAKPENFGVYSARFGNIYTTRQLLQLFERAYGLFQPDRDVWRTDGGWIDAFRPQIQTPFYSSDAVVADRMVHLSAVRRMLEQAEVFIFTLGLTEAWLSRSDGAAVPLAPGVVGAERADDEFRFANLSVVEMADDIVRFIDMLREVNSAVKLLLTVSPVPLIATFEDRHVVVSNELSKSKLRVVADLACSKRQGVTYFPSYEIITSHFSSRSYFEEDMRSVSEAGVSRVMSLFTKHYLGKEAEVKDEKQDQVSPALAYYSDYRQMAGVVCDEEAIVR